jgi:site-specific DNA recombinase
LTSSKRSARRTLASRTKPTRSTASTWAGDLSSRGFGERNRPFEERRRQLEEELPRLQGEIDFLKIQQLFQTSVLTEAQDLYTRWFDLSFEERRGMVETIVERIR